MTSYIIKTENTTFEPEYFHRFKRYFGFSPIEIDLPRGCHIIKPFEHEIVITFVWKFDGKKVQLLNNSYIRIIDTGIRIKWQQSELTPELLSNLLMNIDLGVHKQYSIGRNQTKPIDFVTEIDSAKAAEIQAWIYAADEDTNVVTKFHAKISRSEIRRLDWNLSGEKAHLSDDIIDYYLLLLNERNNIRNDLPKTNSMPAHIFRLYSLYGYKGIHEWNWMEKFHLNFDILLIPICESKHWCLAIVDIKAQTIRYYDSLGLRYAKFHLKKVFKFLNDHNKYHNKFKLNLNDWILEIAANIPMQTNTYDCGVFCCQYAEFISRNHPLDFEQNDIKYLRQKMLYEIYNEKMLN